MAMHNMLVDASVHEHSVPVRQPATALVQAGCAQLLLLLLLVTVWPVT
jgi:hypothetical protein